MERCGTLRYILRCSESILADEGLRSIAAVPIFVTCSAGALRELGKETGATRCEKKRALLLTDYSLCVCSARSTEPARLAGKIELQLCMLLAATH